MAGTGKAQPAANTTAPQQDTPPVTAPKVGDSPTLQSPPQDQAKARTVDLDNLDDATLFEIARRAEARERELAEQAERDAEQNYQTSPVGQLEQELAQQLPRYHPGEIRMSQQKGGFLTSEFDVMGLPASQTYRWVSLDSIHDFSRLWVPLSPTRVTQWEAEHNATGKILVRSFRIERDMVIYKEHVLMIADKASVEYKQNDHVARWNDTFSQRLPPTGQGAVDIDGKRHLQVNSVVSDRAEDMFDRLPAAMRR
jgi:hypothetical protein